MTPGPGPGKNPGGPPPPLFSFRVWVKFASKPKKKPPSDPPPPHFHFRHWGQVGNQVMGAARAQVEMAGATSTLLYGVNLLFHPVNPAPPTEDGRAGGRPRVLAPYHLRVLVPCYKESLEIVVKTLQAALAAELPGGCSRTVYLLDDGRQRDKRKWCATVADSAWSARLTSWRDENDGVGCSALSKSRRTMSCWAGAVSATCAKWYAAPPSLPCAGTVGGRSPAGCSCTARRWRAYGTKHGLCRREACEGSALAHFAGWQRADKERNGKAATSCNNLRCQASSHQAPIDSMNQQRACRAGARRARAAGWCAWIGRQLVDRENPCNAVNLAPKYGVGPARSRRQ